MSYLIAHYAGCPWEVCLGIGVIGTLPDVLAMPETIHGKWDGLYAKYHKWGNILCYLPPAGLHILIDLVWHKPDGGWYWWGYVLEPLIWIGEILLVWRFH